MTDGWESCHELKDNDYLMEQYNCILWEKKGYECHEGFQNVQCRVIRLHKYGHIHKWILNWRKEEEEKWRLDMDKV